MPTTTRLVEHLPSFLAQIAGRIEQRRKELGLTQQQLADRCNEARKEVFSTEELRAVPKISRERIAKILMAKNSSPGRGAARALYPHELKLIAWVLAVPIEWLEGTASERTVIPWEPLTEPRRAQHVAHLIDQHEKNAPHRIGWAEFLPPCLVTEDFMHAHHTAIFGATTPDPMSISDAQEVVRLYDLIGNADRKHVLAMVRQQVRTFTHIMFLSDLTHIAGATGEYSGFSASLRRACLEHLIGLLIDAGPGITLVVADDGSAADEKARLRDCDSLFISGDALAMWRDHSGTMYWSEHPRIVGAKRRLVEALHVGATYQDQADVLRLLTRHLRRIGSAHQSPARTRSQGGVISARVNRRTRYARAD